MHELTPKHRIKARKAHRCDWCGKPIAIGEEHAATSLVCDGRAYTWRECDRCAPYVGPMMDYWDHDGDEGYSGDDMREYMHDVYPGLWDEWQEADRER